MIKLIKNVPKEKRRIFVDSDVIFSYLINITSELANILKEKNDIYDYHVGVYYDNYRDELYMELTIYENYGYDYDDPDYPLSQYSYIYKKEL